MAKGSQKWIQLCCNKKEKYFNQEIHKQTGLPSNIEWLSPKANAYTEYRDNAFLEKLGVNVKTPLHDFWPNRGPVWDALGKIDGMPLLVEAKAHLTEAISTSSRASTESLKTIQSSLNVVKTFLKVNPEIPWHLSFYQYTNRIAHIYYLRLLNKIPAHLLFVNYINDTEMKGPKNKETWDACYQILEAALGLKPKHALSKYIHHVVIDVKKL